MSNGFEAWRDWRPGDPTPSGVAGDRNAAHQQAQTQGGQLSSDQVMGWVNTIGGLMVAIGGQIAAVVGQDSAGNLVTSEGQTLPPGNYTIPDADEAWYENELTIPLLVGGALLLVLLLRPRMAV